MKPEDICGVCGMAYRYHESGMAAVATEDGNTRTCDFTRPTAPHARAIKEVKTFRLVARTGLHVLQAILADRDIRVLVSRLDPELMGEIAEARDALIIAFGEFPRKED